MPYTEDGNDVTSAKLSLQYRVALESVNFVKLNK